MKIKYHQENERERERERRRRRRRGREKVIMSVTCRAKIINRKGEWIKFSAKKGKS